MFLVQFLMSQTTRWISSCATYLALGKRSERAPSGGVAQIPNVEKTDKSFCRAYVELKATRKPASHLYMNSTRNFRDPQFGRTPKAPHNRWSWTGLIQKAEMSGFRRPLLTVRHVGAGGSRLPWRRLDATCLFDSRGVQGGLAHGCLRSWP